MGREYGKVDYGDWTIALGHRRLAIIDIEGGRQPLCNEDQSVWITFNGEIYNFQNLQARTRTSRPSICDAVRYRSDRPRLRGPWRTDSHNAQRHVCLCGVGSGGGQAAACARSHRHQAAVLCAASGWRNRICIGTVGLARTSGGRPNSRSGRAYMPVFSGLHFAAAHDRSRREKA